MQKEHRIEITKFDPSVTKESLAKHFGNYDVFDTEVIGNHAYVSFHDEGEMNKAISGERDVKHWNVARDLRRAASSNELFPANLSSGKKKKVIGAPVSEPLSVDNKYKALQEPEKIDQEKAGN